MVMLYHEYVRVPYISKAASTAFKIGTIPKTEQSGRNDKTRNKDIQVDGVDDKDHLGAFEELQGLPVSFCHSSHFVHDCLASTTHKANSPSRLQPIGNGKSHTHAVNERFLSVSFRHL